MDNNRELDSKTPISIALTAVPTLIYNLYNENQQHFKNSVKSTLLMLALKDDKLLKLTITAILLPTQILDTEHTAAWQHRRR